MIRLRVKRDELGQHSDEGSALVLALVFLTVVSVLIAAILSFADVSFRATTAIRDYDKIAYAADGAIDAAINHYRTSATAGVAGRPCPDFITSVNDISVTVSCEANTSTSGISSGGSGANALNTPSNAILAVGTSSPQGQQGVIQQASSATLTVQGNVFSHYTIKSGTGIFNVVSGTVTARNSCEGTFTTPPLCNIGSATPTMGADPDYPSLTASTVFRSAPSCPSSVTQTVVFEPGFYSKGQALSDLTDGGCLGRVFWFKPGVYYFDFLDGTPVWTIDDATADIVGGTPNGWTAAPPGLTRPVIPLANVASPDVRACKTEDDATPNDGVQFIFGGPSRIALDAGRVQLCAQPSSDSQQIVIYGGKTGGSLVDPNQPIRGSAASAGSGTGQFSNPTNALTVGGGTSDAVLNSGGSARVTLAGFAAPIPSSAIMSKATMRIAHNSGASVSRVTATVFPSSGAPLVVTGTAQTCASDGTRLCIVTTGNPNAVSNQSVDLLALGLTGPSRFSGVTITYEAQAASDGNNAARTEKLDGIELDIQYLTSRRAQDAGVDLITSSGNASNLMLAGTLYAPRADLDIQLPNQSTQVFGRGIVCRSIRINVPASQVSSAATIKIPSASPGGSSGDREVLFVARVSGTTRLRALVGFVDSVSVGQTVLIKKWSVVR